MNRGLTLATGVGIGAALMYILDPDRGARRRSLLRDKCVSASHKTGDLAGKASRDLRNRAQGLIAEARSKFSSETVSDEVLIERVRAELGRHPVHQRALQITAYQGEVRLSGPALASEVEEIVKAVSAVRGVEGVDNQLEVHEQAGSISSLQGEVRQPLAS